MTSEPTTTPLNLSAISDVLDLGEDGVQASLATVADTRAIFDQRGLQFRPVPGYPQERYAPWGDDNRLPYLLRELIGSDEVTAQNKLFNVLTCYGQGLRLADADDAEKAPATVRAEALDWCERCGMDTYLLEQATDLKYYFFTVSVLILSRDGRRINRLVHKDACFCRLREADARGRLRHVYYADWTAQPLGPGAVERIPLLPAYDPLGELERLMGRAPGRDGLSRVRTQQRKFALLTRFPTVGCQYYPTPYYAAMFRGGSYDEKRLISAAKTAKLRNHASVKYQVEVLRGYWERIIDEERITDEAEKCARIKKEKENIRDFVAGVHNSGKAWITNYYVNPMGHEERDVRVFNIEGAKEGGDYADDINVAANTLCYADNTHPNLVGAVPGKSQNNNSGSDKRELFTMKQALERPYKDLLLRPMRLCLRYNGWQALRPEIPITQLTTLDQHRDAVESL